MATPKIHIHTSSPDAFFVNSFIVEGDRSLVLVDTQFVLSEANALVEKMAALGKPLAAIFITHPHPDHYNGLATVLEKYPGTPVHATAGTIAGIHETAEPKRAYWTPIVGANYPQTFAFPDITLADKQRLSIDGIDLQVFDFGAAECSDNTMIALLQMDAVIISDLVYNRVHPWLAEGRSLKWLAALEAAAAHTGGASALYGGHGAPGTPAIITEQAAYITTVRDLVESRLRLDGSVTDAGKMALVERIGALYPGWPLAMIIGMTVDGIAAEYSA